MEKVNFVLIDPSSKAAESKKRRGRPKNTTGGGGAEEQKMKARKNSGKPLSLFGMKRELERLEDKTLRYERGMEEMVEFFQESKITKYEHFEKLFERLHREEMEIQQRNEYLKGKIESLQKDTEKLNESFIEYQFTTPQDLKELKNKKETILSEKKKLMDKIEMLQNQKMELLDFFINNDITHNLNHDLKVAFKKLKNKKADIRKLKSEKMVLEAEMKLLRVHIKQNKGHLQNTTVDRPKMEFHWTLGDDSRWLEMVLERLKDEIRMISVQNKLLLCFKEAHIAKYPGLHNFEQNVEANSRKCASDVGSTTAKDMELHETYAGRSLPKDGPPLVCHEMLTRLLEVDDDDEEIEMSAAGFGFDCGYENLIDFKGYKIPEGLLPTATILSEKTPTIFPIPKGTKQIRNIQTKAVILVCAVVLQIENMTYDEMNRDTFQRWSRVVNDAECLGFNVNLVRSGLERVARNYLSHVPNEKGNYFSHKQDLQREELNRIEEAAKKAREAACIVVKQIEESRAKREKKTNLGITPGTFVNWI